MMLTIIAFIGACLVAAQCGCDTVDNKVVRTNSAVKAMFEA